MENEYDGLRSFIRSCEAMGECITIEEADWELEIGGLTEAAAEFLNEPPMILFDKIRGYPEGFRILSLPFGSTKRFALALGLPTDRSKLELVRLAADKVKNAEPLPPAVVEKGPVLQNVITGEAIDILRFPALYNRDKDGGRYIGTGDAMINKDPDSDFVNVGTYRIQIHEPALLGLNMSPGQQGKTICERYWRDGKSCPVVVTFGMDPRIFLVAHTKYPWGQSELDYVGGLMEMPLDVIAGPLTGLPIPAHSEIAIEGEVPPPDEESRPEGPFGEWTGYYSGGTKETAKQQPVIRIKAIYYRDDPILLNMSPLWPGAPDIALRYSAGLIWDQLEAVGVPDVVGVFAHNAYFIVVAIRQRYAGHAKQAGLAALNCAAAARNGRYIVVVDEDIDPTSIQEVLWAMETRVDPATDLEIINDCWSTPLDPRMPPEKRRSGDHTNSRAIFYAVRPYVWKDDFPVANRGDPDFLKQIMKKYSDVLPFPTG